MCTVDGHIGAVEVTQRRRERHAVHHLLLAECRQLGDVLQPADVARLDALCAPQPLVERDQPRALHQLGKALLLQREQLVARAARELLCEGIAQRVVGQ